MIGLFAFAIKSGKNEGLICACMTQEKTENRIKKMCLIFIIFEINFSPTWHSIFGCTAQYKSLWASQPNLN